LALACAALKLLAFSTVAGAQLIVETYRCVLFSIVDVDHDVGVEVDACDVFLFVAVVLFPLLMLSPLLSPLPLMLLFVQVFLFDALPRFAVSTFCSLRYELSGQFWSVRPSTAILERAICWACCIHPTT